MNFISIIIIYIAVKIMLLMNIESCDFPSKGRNIGINEKYFKLMLLYVLKTVDMLLFVPMSVY